jgi:hypothetical protein
MTRKEAQKKWCQNTQLAVGVAGDIITNRFSNTLDSCCLADGCACWVWDRRYEIPSYGNEGQPKNLPESKWEGHCGLIQR